MNSPRDLPNAVAEIQGLYGPFTFPETLLQRLWLRGEFASTQAVTADGQRVRILSPGQWNHLGGPDFKGARIEYEGKTVTGDVEVHLRAREWQLHGHARDPAYREVILHVVLFPGEETATEGVGQRRVPILPLLPLLPRALEEYAMEDAIERLAGRASRFALEEWRHLTPDTWRQRLRRHATRRWQEKVRYARQRWERLGWTQACHVTALEILGYRLNRAPMLRLATAWPLEAWEAGRVDADRAYAAEAEHWKIQGGRPANHVYRRLCQYAAWTARVSAWPDRLRTCLEGLSDAPRDLATRTFRRRVRLGFWRRELARVVNGFSVAGSRWDNCVCDGFWPLWAASTQTESAGEWWFHWLPGDQSAAVMAIWQSLAPAEDGEWPACHGFMQGLWGCLLAEEHDLAEGGFPGGEGLDSICPGK